MFFSELVSYETVCMAGFNEWEPSFCIYKNDRMYTAHHGRIPETETNILVIEGERLHKDDYWRREWYFGTFTGKHSGECKTKEESESYFNKIREIIVRKNRVAGKKLEESILEVLNSERE